MNSFTKTYAIRASVHDVWKALTDPKTIDVWGGGPAKMSPVAGTRFSLWGGDIHGTNIEVIPEKKLKQEWYSGGWKEPSIVTFELSGDTKVKLTHANIPDSEFSDIKSGWDDYYMLPLKQWVEAHR